MPGGRRLASPLLVRAPLLVRVPGMQYRPQVIKQSLEPFRVLIPGGASAPPDPPIKSAWRPPNMDMYSGCYIQNMDIYSGFW